MLIVTTQKETNTIQYIAKDTGFPYEFLTKLNTCISQNHSYHPQMTLHLPPLRHGSHSPIKSPQYPN